MQFAQNIKHLGTVTNNKQLGIYQKTIKNKNKIRKKRSLST